MSSGKAEPGVNLLDHGYVRVVESWGSDQRVIEAARMSTDKGFQGWDTDARLLAYLYRNQHMTPFEMAGAVLEIKAPIFVFREWHRHRTQSYNELSARYTPLPNENYLPSLARLMQPSTANTQAKAVMPLASNSDLGAWLHRLEKLYETAQDVYTQGLELGVPKELARLPVPVARYSRMRASANLRNWLSFLTLRTAANAQYEIREYAQRVQELLTGIFPRTLALFEQGQAK